MSEWIQQTMNSSSPSVAVLLAALLLGLIGAVTSCGCNLALIGAVAGYSGSLAEGNQRKHILFGGVFFMLGTVIALAILGAVTGWVGKVAGESLGKYWRFAAGLIMVFFGLASLDFLPFKLPSLRFGSDSAKRSLTGSVVYGLAVGGGTTACSVFCNPILPVVLGYTTLQGGTFWGTTVLGIFALGYSLPLAAGLVGLGLGLGKLRQVAQKASPIIRIVTGVLLLGVGFYLLLRI